MNPLVITAAIVGAETMKTDNPNVPYTPEEIAIEAEKCESAGATMVHVHGRLADGTPTQDRDTFGQILHKIRERTELLVQFSTGGAVGMSVEERIDAVDLRPDMATLTTGTVNFGDDVFMNDWKTVCEIAKQLKANGIKPEIEVFDTGMVDSALRLLKKELIEAPLHFDFVLGVPGGMGGSSDRLDFLLTLIPEGSTWSVAGVGRFELPLAYRAIDLGGHVRVGLEDNIYIEKGVLAKGSWELVSKVNSYAASVGRPIATPAQAREILGLASKN